MAIFRRGRKDDVADPGGDVDGGRGDGAADSNAVASVRMQDVEDGDGPVDGRHPVESSHPGDQSQDGDAADAEEERYGRARGPFDAKEVDAYDPDVERIDLGALRIAPVDGMQLRLELDQEQQSVVSVHALLGDSGVQLQAYAAPRTLGVWPDIRSEIARSVIEQGGTAEVAAGPLGRELVARIPARGADGRTVSNQVRFLGVDGPRWFLRAVISGPAATDDAKAAALVDLVRSVVVVRDDEARPPREALALTIPTTPAPESPDEATELDAVGAADEVNEADHADGADQATGRPTRSAEDLRPFERGPEITEVR